MERNIVLGEKSTIYFLKRREIKMKIAICDDESTFIDQLKPIVNMYANKRKIQAAVDLYNSGEDLLSSPQMYDIIFLDYQMSGLNGMEVARELRKRNMWSSIVFVTNHTDFVYTAFLVEAFRFLRKPVSEEKITQTLDAYFEKYGNDYPILLKSDRQYYKINTKDIVFLEAHVKHCTVHTIEKKYDVAKTMSVVKTQLPLEHFYRTHKSFIVNLNAILYVSDEIIHFVNGEEALIGQRKLRKFKKDYRDYCAMRPPLPERDTHEDLRKRQMYF